MLVHVPDQLGYAGVAGIVLAESAGIPVPGETARIAAGLLAGAGHLSQRALDAGERVFARHGAKTVVLGRWVTGVRVVAALVAGVAVAVGAVLLGVARRAATRRAAQAAAS